MTILTSILDKSNPEKGYVFVGRNEGNERIMLQSHINLTANDKLYFGANYLKPDPNQGIYEVEYGKKFDRLDTGIKYTSNGMTSASGVATIAKNCFIGVEAALNVI